MAYVHNAQVSGIAAIAGEYPNRFQTMSKKENPFSVYAKVSQLAFVIVTPLLVFLLGGSYVVKRFNLPDWVMLICVGLAILFMLSGAINYILKIVHYYEQRDKDKKTPMAFTSSRRDNDYYDDYRNIRK